MTDIFRYNKEKFLIKVKDNNIKNMFDNISDFESISATGDLCKFNIKEFEALLAYLGTSKKRSLSTIKADMSRIYDYLSYCQSLPGASLTEEKIKNYYKQDFHSMERWLNSLGVYTDYSKTTISINDMLKIHTSNNMFDGQDEALFWLLFLGVELDEIVNIGMNQVDNWQGLLKGNIQLNADIKEDISIALNRARNQDSIEKNGPYGVITHPTLKGNKYLFRSDKGNGNFPVSSAAFNRRYVKLKDCFGKYRLGVVDMRKSGMLYFASELINSNNINSKNDFNSKIFNPICKMYREDPKSYLQTFHDLIFSDVLKEYYNITVPETAREKKVTTNTLNDPAQYDKTDKKPWRDDEELGLKGETLLLEELKHRYNTCYKTKDYSGFDIYAKNNNNDLRCIEVKTMRNKKCKINITKHEYEIANSLRYREYYWIYLIIENEPLVYSYKNFFGLLGINDMDEKIFQNNVLNGMGSMGSYSYRDFSITLSEDFFDKCEEHLELSRVW